MMDHKSPEAFRTISEVADWLGVPTHVLRFWESRFAQVKPVKRAGGRRYYRPADMELLGGIRKLLHEDGMTIRGVQKLLREQGVKHVAAMSPPLDTGSEDIVDSNVVDLSEARESVAEPESEAAPEPEPEAEEPAAESPSLAEEKWAELIGGAAPTPDAETEPAEPVADAEQTAEPEAAEAESEAADAAPETAAEADDSAHGDGEPDPFVLTDPNPTPGAAEIGDALPDPDAADFLAHEAPPETADGDAGPFETAEADSAAAASDETEAADAMSSPEALEFAAHDGEPETTETETGEETPSEATEAELDLGDLAALDGADEAAVAAPPEGETGVDAAGIGPDPDDDAYAPDAPLMAVRLRDARARRARLNVARLGALADRLEELAGRMKGDGGPHRPL